MLYLYHPAFPQKIKGSYETHQLSFIMFKIFKDYCILLQFEGQMGNLAEPREFMRNDHLGFILTCPSNLGTGVRCSVHARFPLLASDKRYDLDKICLALRLQKRGTSKLIQFN